MKTPLKVDLYKHVSPHISTLKFFHVWLYISHTRYSYKYWLSFISRFFIGVFNFVLPTGFQIAYLVKIMISGDSEIQEIASIANLVITELMVSFKLVDLTIRRSALTDLFEQLKSKEFLCYHEVHRQILEKSIRFSRNIYTGYLIWTASVVTVHMVIVPSLHHFDKLPLKMDFIFFDLSDPAYFKYVCAFQLLYKPTMVSTYIALPTLCWACMCCANSQLDVLINKLENMKNLVRITKAERSCGENEAFEIIFREIESHHSAVMRFAGTLQKVFGGQLSMSLFMSASIIGTTAIQIFSIESPRKNMFEVTWVLAYFFILLGSLFVDCYFGNALTLKSTYLATAAFACPWLNVPTKMKRNLVIFIAKTQRPIVLTAAKLAPVSIESFTKVMNWTYKGFAVLNQMRN